jgi:molybdenum cofactor synthesis domain-containing protein
MMLPQGEAYRLVIGSFSPNPPVTVGLHEAVGAVLASDVVCDIDMPPFDRSAMDGYAVRGDSTDLELLPEIPAGSIGGPVEAGQAAPIMTGAPVPNGADRVVMVEKTQIRDRRVVILDMAEEGANICRRGEDIRSGEVVLSAGAQLTPNRIGIAAMAGRELVDVRRPCRVGLLTTGTEVVAPGSAPGPGQVRNANLPMMRTLLAGAPGEVCAAMHSADDPDSLRSCLDQLISACDVVVVAGGVSMGTRDYVPGVLKELGVEILFDRVAQKPGKPLTFGLAPQGARVFGMPGNPVSGLVCMEEYLLPALRKAAGMGSFAKRDHFGTAGFAHSKKPKRLEFVRVMARLEDTGWKLEMPESSGSGDLMSTRDTNALAVVERRATSVAPGERLLFHLYSFAAGGIAFE